ncbi:nicotinate-nucleotide adenylyltransferase [Pacificibacter marinus]|uniref:Probable nicotinate-nucleotide adenylyltransferase n=1 Tax=Pacificibacter marinus TaxID=658057 RepID=A0A1Y5SIT2_9RHOB|nr:nicotinate-nucleotide adenylyltransferase [Pacificibacter marinus]SEK52753.1 nicotinate-nucleotide adenylyltransferase [Pacificibacter marinus]SLN38595.1 putative nicotinate-nucleotide adenylyltransferase [Pacificibacter marinus]
MRHALPYARAGQVIGLLGGSFDPAHEGHVHITKAALKRFDLDRVWWLVSPANPLKSVGPAPIEKRLQRARAVMDHPRVEVTDLESQLGTRYTAQMLDKLHQMYPGVTFVWLMGADNLKQFHRWQNWRGILATTPIGVIARPGQRVAARTSVAASIFECARLPARASHLLGQVGTPAWCFVNVPMNDASSTEIRNAGDWQRG